LYDAKTVAPHPQQKTLLPLGSGIDARVKKGAQKSAVAEKHAQKFVVIDINVMKTRRVKKIIAVDKNCYATAMSELPGTCRRVKLHCFAALFIVIWRLFRRRLKLNLRTKK
jgi:hypothetical protein